MASRALSLDEAARTVEVTFATDAPVRRRDRLLGDYDEQLSLEAGAVLMDRLASGRVNVLDSHQALGLRNVVGVVERAWVQSHGGRREGRAVVRFSGRAEVEPIWRDVVDGIIRNVSVGYDVSRWERVERKGQPPLLRAAEWTPVELSLVPIPADAGTFVRANLEGLRTMTVEACASAPEAPARLRFGEPPPRAAEPAPAPDLAAAERQRCQAIRQAARAFGLDAEGDRLIADGTPLDRARELLIDEAARRQEATQVRAINPYGHGTGWPAVTSGYSGDDPAVIRQRMAGAMAHRLSHGRVPLADESREYRGMSLLDMGRELAAARGVRLRSSVDVADWLIRGGGMHTTSDFAAMVGDGAGRALLARFEQLPPALRPIARRATASDYRPIRRLRLGEGSGLAKVLEHGEVERGTLGETSEAYALERYARIFALSRKLIVNDDLNAFQDFLDDLGTKAATLLGDVLANVIINNAAMSDGVALFHASHNNLGTAAAISVTSLSAGRLAMRGQKGVDGSPIQMAPKYLVVGPQKETEAEQVLSQLSPGTVGDANPFANRLELIVEPRLTGNQWYLVSDPAFSPLIEYAEMDGSRPMTSTGPQVETRPGFDVEGLETKVSYDVGAAAIDWRAAWRNPGA